VFTLKITFPGALSNSGRAGHFYADESAGSIKLMERVTPR